MRIEEIDQAKHLILIYKISEITDRTSALRWFAHAINKKLINDFCIDLEDFRSFHDGSESICLTQLPQTDLFIEKYIKSNIVSASITGTFENKNVSIGISLEDGLVSLSCQKCDLANYRKLEQLLGLV